MKYPDSSRLRHREYDQRQAVRAFSRHASEKFRKETDQRRVRQSALDIATADATKVVQVQRCNCRWCWGANNEYQRTDWEMQRDLDRFLASNRKGITFPQMGGSGFNKWRDPNPDCPICFGHGEEMGFVKDFRKLTARERNSIASVKFGKNGAVEEIKFHNKIDAIREFAKIDGMVVEKKTIRVIDATEEDLDEYFAKNGVTIDHNDPDFAPFLAKMVNGPEPVVTDAESTDIVDDAVGEDQQETTNNGDPDPA